jgi:hypothetical protein
LFERSEFIHFSFSGAEIALKFEYSLDFLVLFHQGKRTRLLFKQNALVKKHCFLDIIH